MDWKPKLQFSNFYPNLTLSPLNFISINASSITAIVALLLFFSSDQIRTIAAVAPPLLRSLITVTHGKSKKFLSSLKFIFLFFFFLSLLYCSASRLALYPFFYELWWRLFVSCGFLILFYGLVCCVMCGQWTVD